MFNKIFFTLLCSCFTFAVQGTLSGTPSAENSKISKAYGHIIAESLNTPGLELDIESLIQGMKDEVSGVPSPMSEEECTRALAKLQEEAFINPTRPRRKLGVNGRVMFQCRWPDDKLTCS